MSRIQVFAALSVLAAGDFCPCASADVDRVRAFVGTWAGSGEQVVVESSGNGKQTGGVGVAGQSSTTTFKITGVRVAGGDLIADYVGDTAGSLIFYCAANDNAHRSSITQDGRALDFNGPNDLFKSAEDTIKSRRQQYCAH